MPRVTATKLFQHRGAIVRAGEVVNLSATDAVMLSRQGKVSLTQVRAPEPVRAMSHEAATVSAPRVARTGPEPTPPPAPLPTPPPPVIETHMPGPVDPSETELPYPGEELPEPADEPEEGDAPREEPDDPERPAPRKRRGTYQRRDLTAERKR